MTLNQIIQRIKEIAEAHAQINTFFFGDADDFLSSDVTYPACFMSIPSETISGQIGQNSESRLSCTLFFMDRNIQGGDSSDNTFNQTEVLSDMREVAHDIFSQLRYQKFEPVWNVLPDSTIEMYTEDTQDFNAGVRLQFTIKMPYLVNRCQVPTTFNYG